VCASVAGAQYHLLAPGLAQREHVRLRPCRVPDVDDQVTVGDGQAGCPYPGQPADLESGAERRGSPSPASTAEPPVLVALTRPEPGPSCSRKAAITGVAFPWARPGQLSQYVTSHHWE
jgi:hypothetical protein